MLDAKRRLVAFALANRREDLAGLVAVRRDASLYQEIRCILMRCCL